MGNWQADAREFGQFVRQGGWRLGLLVARNCGPGMRKVSITQFSIEARIGTSTVANHLAAWERAADENLVPHARDLTPDSEPQISSAELPEWRQFYRSDRQLAGRTGSVEIHPDPTVMKRRLADRPELVARTTETLVSVLEPPAKAALAERLSAEVEATHVPPPLPPEQRPTFIVVESVQRVLDALALVREESKRLPPVMTRNSKSLLAEAAAQTQPTITMLRGLVAEREAG